LSLALIENASDRDPPPPKKVCPEAFPIKASDHSEAKPFVNSTLSRDVKRQEKYTHAQN